MSDRATLRPRGTSGGSPTATRFRSRKSDREAYLYLLPGALFSLFFVLLPMGHALVLSFFEWNVLQPPEWVGLDNYETVLTDSDFRTAFKNSAILIVFFSILPITQALFLTAVMTRSRVKGLAIFRAILFLPQVLPLVVVGLVWRWIYSPAGLLNTFLSGVGLDSLTRPWLGDFTWSIVAVGFVGNWVIYGLAMIMFMAGVQKIDLALYEAARIDGAGAIREFFAVTLPGLRREFIVVLTLTVLTALKAFDLVFIMTQGGPGKSTTVPAFELFNAAFTLRRVGLSVAVAVVLGIVVIAFMSAVFVYSRRWED